MNRSLNLFLATLMLGTLAILASLTFALRLNILLPIALFAVAEWQAMLHSVRLTPNKQVNLNAAIKVASIVMGGPAVSVWAAFFASLAAVLSWRNSPQRSIFNLTIGPLSVGAAAGMYLVAKGEAGSVMLGSSLVAALTHMLVSTLLFGLLSTMLHSQRLLSTVRDLLLSDSNVVLAEHALGLIAAFLLIHGGLLWIAVLAAMLLFLYRMMLEYQKALADKEAAAFVATHDKLTGVLNRAGLEEALRWEVEKAKEGHYPISIVMLDVNRFKEINDTFGHAMGDEALRLVSRNLRANVRASDTLGRYGGDEFVLVMPHLDARQAADRLQFLHAMTGAPLCLGDIETTLPSLSFGIATLPQDGDSVRELLEHADGAMYQYKVKSKQGRDTAVKEKRSPQIRQTV